MTHSPSMDARQATPSPPPNLSADRVGHPARMKHAAFVMHVFRNLLGGALLLLSMLPRAAADVAIPSLQDSALDPALKGLILLEELNCVACHATDAAFAKDSKRAPRLAAVGSRVNPQYLVSFLQDPHGVKPGTTMPDRLAYLSAAEKQTAAIELTHFLLSRTTNDFSLTPPDAVAATHGERLFHSRGCAACHSPRDGQGNELLPKTSVPLGRLESKYSFRSLVDFLRQPHSSRPSGRMPDLRLSGTDLERIAHYLLRGTRVPGHLAYTLYRGDVWEGLGSDNVKPERAGLVADFAPNSLGRVEHHTAIVYEGWINLSRAGRYSFFLNVNGGSLFVDGQKIIEQEPSDRRGIKQLEGSAELAAGWRRIQLTYFQTGYEPSFSFEMAGPQFARQAIPSSLLSISNEPIPAFEPLAVSPEFAARGREKFGTLGCARCHDDLLIPSQAATPWAKLDPHRGCLSEATGPWPRFPLNPQQREWIAQALPSATQQHLDPTQRVNKTLVTFNCLACHERTGLGGVAPERKALFTGTREALGDEGRLPPPMTHVGAKLKREWISEVLLHGQRQRDYLETVMPQFGEANVGQLVDLFGQVDSLEPVTFPKVTDLPSAKAAGLEMFGSTGLSCIACHDYNGQKSGGAGALDIVHATERLQKNWFHLYLREPARFHPTGIMPSYWPGGQSTRPDILKGDAAQQIEALWLYLEDGTRARKPAGLSRQARELRVGTVAEICRGQGPVGYRGIAVGYPQGLNLAFDSEQMSLRLLWKGEFANVDLGSFSPRGTERIAFPSGIPFHRLKSLDDFWPYKGKTNYTFPQDQGYQFRGYHLDALRRPTFLYQYGEVSVTDFFEDFRDPDGRTGFKRTFHFTAPTAQLPGYFRAASGRKITRQSDQAFIVDQLHLRLLDHSPGIVRAGDPGEILIPLTIPQGTSTLTLEYQW